MLGLPLDRRNQHRHTAVLGAPPTNGRAHNATGCTYLRHEHAEVFHPVELDEKRALVGSPPECLVPVPSAVQQLPS